MKEKVLRRKYVDAYDVHFHSTGESAAKAEQKALMKRSAVKLKKIHRNVINAYMTALQVDEKHFTPIGRGELIALKNLLARLIDDISAVKKARGIK